MWQLVAKAGDRIQVMGEYETEAACEAARLLFRFLLTACHLPPVPGVLT